jgi:hypothetical protein
VYLSCHSSISLNHQSQTVFGAAVVQTAGATRAGTIFAGGGGGVTPIHVGSQLCGGGGGLSHVDMLAHNKTGIVYQDRKRWLETVDNQVNRTPSVPKAAIKL